MFVLLSLTNANHLMYISFSLNLSQTYVWEISVYQGSSAVIFIYFISFITFILWLLNLPTILLWLSWYLNNLSLGKRNIELVFLFVQFFKFCFNTFCNFCFMLKSDNYLFLLISFLSAKWRQCWSISYSKVEDIGHCAWNFWSWRLLWWCSWNQIWKACSCEGINSDIVFKN